MSEIFGWCGTAFDTGKPQDILSNKEYHICHSAQIETANLSILESTGSSIYLYNNEKIICALEGHFYWDTLASSKKHINQAQVLAEEYLKHNEKCLNDIKGAFSLVIMDVHNKKVILAVDRMGIRKLCYHINGDSILAASRSDQIIKHPSVNATIDKQSIFQYLYFHMIPSPATIYQGIYKVPAGKYVVFKDGKQVLKKYWKPSFTKQNKPKNALAEELVNKLTHAVKKFDSSNTGTFLSGGLDSSTVTGLLSGIRPQPHAYSIGFDEKGYDELEFARVAAHHFDVKLHEYVVTPNDIVNSIHTIVESLDEPFGNSSLLPTYYCAKLAKENGRSALLAGDGGDELFAGNARYAKQKLFELYYSVPSTLRQHLIEPTLHTPKLVEKLLVTRKIKRYIEQAKVRLPDRLTTYNFFHITSANHILQADFLNEIDQDNPLKTIRSAYADTDSTDYLDRMLHLDWKHTLADNDLRKVNQMCDLIGIDVHYPMLDDELVEFSTTIPSSVKMPYFKLRGFYKEALKNILPKEIINKQKHGFGLPFGLWMKKHKPLSELTLDSITNLKKRDILNPIYLDNLIKQHQDEHAAYYGEFMWVLMTLEIWLSAKQE